MSGLAQEVQFEQGGRLFLLVGEGVVSDQGDSVPAGVSAVRTRIGLGVGQNFIENLVVVREDVVLQIAVVLA